MSLILENSDQEIKKIQVFIQKILQNAHKNKVVIAVSGGIDSVLSLALLSKTLDKKYIFPIFLPYKNQDMDDAKLATEFLKIPKNNWREINIKLLVDAAAVVTKVNSESKFADISKLRLGNIMARSRMMIIYDLAKKLDALVCGTENKSEKFLGYFTRFGDEASDFEPIVHLYKTQVRQLVDFLKLPKIFLKKKSSAGLWVGQTDEQELGFSYTQADQVIAGFFEEGLSREEISSQFGISSAIAQKILQRVESMAFKGEVPYCL